MLDVQGLSLKKKQYKLFTSFILAMLIFCMSGLPAFAATPEKTVNASATLAYNLKGFNTTWQFKKPISRINICTSRSVPRGPAIFQDCSLTAMTLLL